MSEYCSEKTETLKLQAKTEEIRDRISRLERDWSRAAALIQDSRGYWAGEASIACQKSFGSCQEDMQVIFKRLRDHTKDLLILAGIDEEKEDEKARPVRVLPADSII